MSEFKLGEFVKTKKIRGMLIGFYGWTGKIPMVLAYVPESHQGLRAIEVREVLELWEPEEDEKEGFRSWFNMIGGSLNSSQQPDGTSG